jgi:hypothetical protein
VTLLVTRDIILLSIEMNNWNVEAWLGSLGLALLGMNQEIAAGGW